MHLLSAQTAIWGTIRCRSWLADRAGQPRRQLAEPHALAVSDWPCACVTLDRRVWVWAPVER